MLVLGLPFFVSICMPPSLRVCHVYVHPECPTCESLLGHLSCTRHDLVQPNQTSRFEYPEQLNGHNSTLGRLKPV